MFSGACDKCSMKDGLLILSRVTLVLLVLCSTVTQAARAQEPVYERVLDLAFSYPPENFRQAQYRLILRFVPSFGTESQILISGRYDGKVEFVTYALHDPTSSIWDITYRQVRSGTSDAQTIAKNISVNKNVMGGSMAELEGLLAAFFDLQLSMNLNRDLGIHGTSYDLKFETISNQIHFRLTDADDPDAGAYPLVQWMNKVKRVAFSSPEGR